MNVRAIVFSRDRAAQLDLLLSSLRANAPGLLDSLTVLWRASDDLYRQAYDTCAEEHPDVEFVVEHSFADDVRSLLAPAELVVFFTDDSVLFRSLEDRERTPQEWLADDPELLCFSLRLGRNCEECYPYGCRQRLPDFASHGDALSWAWGGADCDFGYPMSLDGHIMEAEVPRQMLGAQQPANPNELEALLAHAVGSARVAKSPPDGYTMVMGSRADAINQTLYKKQLYNLLEDFIPVVLIADQPTILITPNEFPASTMPEFIDYVKKNQAILKVASAGAGFVTAAKSSLIRASGRLRVINTTRLPRSPSQRSNSTGGWARCWTNCTSTGPLQPSILRKPLTRSRSAPRNSARVSIVRAKAGHWTGALAVNTKLPMSSLCSASAMKPLRSTAEASVKQRESSAPLTAVARAARGLSVRNRVVSLSVSAGPARSALVTISVSARMTCLRASTDQSSVVTAVAASTTAASTSR